MNHITEDLINIIFRITHLILAFRPMMVQMAMRGGGRMMFSMSAKGSNIRLPRKTELAPVTHVRKLFPETWLWKTLETSYVVRMLVMYVHIVVCFMYSFSIP